MRILLIGLLLSGCVAAVPVTVPVRGGGTCDAGPVQAMVGQPATAALGQDALSRSGAAVLRWVPEGAMVTMDFRRDRLNLKLDARGNVREASCG